MISIRIPLIMGDNEGRKAINMGDNEGTKLLNKCTMAKL